MTTRLSTLSNSFAALILLATAAQAAPVEYECTFKPHGSGGFIPEKALYWIDSAERTALAYDGVIHHFQGKPLEARFNQPTTQRVAVLYTIDDFAVTSDYDGPLSLKVSYRVDINTSTRKAKVKVKLGRDARNNLTGSGTCKLR